MVQKRSAAVTVFGFLMIAISIIFINVAAIAKAIAYSHGVEREITIIALLGWLVPALLGLGILRLSNFFRIATLCVNAVVIIWTPVMYFYLRGSSTFREASMPLFSKYELIDLFLLLFSAYSIYFLTRANIKEQFNNG